MTDYKDELVSYAIKVARGQVTEGDKNRVEAIGRALDKGLEVPASPMAPAPEAKASEAPKPKSFFSRGKK